MTIGRVAAALVLALLLGGCFGGSAPVDQFYRLDVRAPAALSSPVLPGVVEVGRFAAEGLTGERALLYSYRDRPDQLSRYGYHLWVEPPPVLLQNQLVAFLRETRAAGTVVTADLRVPPDILVEGRLKRFEQIAGANPSVVVEMDLGVVRLHGGELVSLKTYRVERPVPDELPANAVVAFQAALGEIFGRFLHDLTEKSRTP